MDKITTVTWPCYLVRMRWWSLLLLLTGSGGQVCCAQRSGEAVHATGPAPIFSVDQIGVDEGLLHRMVVGLAQDARGFLWVATPVGMQRYDGYTFKDITTNEGLAHASVGGLVKDADGLFWILYKEGGRSQRFSHIDILDPLTGQVQGFAEHFGDRQPCPVNELGDRIAVGPDGSLVLATDTMLYTYRSAAEGFLGVRVSGLPDGVLKPLVMSRDGSCWLFCQVDHTQRPWLVRVGPEGHLVPGTLRRARVGIATAYDRGMQAVPAGAHLLVQEMDSTWAHEVWITPEGELITAEGAVPAGLLEGWVTSSVVRLEEDLWLVDGQVRRVREGEATLSAPVLFDLLEEFPEVAVQAVAGLRSRDGLAWLATSFGLYKVRWHAPLFARFLHDPEARTGFGNSIRGMALVGGRLYVNTEKMGRYVLDPRTGEVLAREEEGTLRYGMVPDGEGGVWDSKATTLVHRLGDGTHRDLEGAPRAIWSLLPVTGDSLLLGLAEGLAWAHPRSGAISPLAHTGRSTFLPLFRDRNGGLWAASTGGLYELDPNGSPRAVWWRGDSLHFLPCDAVRHVYEDPDGIFWMATSSGLVAWDRSSGSVRTFGRQEGLSNTSLYAVHPDGDGGFWLPSDAGLIRYDPMHRTGRTFRERDGVAHDEFNRLAQLRAPDGTLYFGGLNGITVVPSGLAAQASVGEMPFVITEVTQFDGDEERVVDRTTRVLDGRGLQVRPRDRFFTLRMALLGYEDPEDVRYAWRIADEDTAWVEQASPELRLTSLPFGDHTLELRADLAGGRWSTPIQVPLLVAWPWYLRWYTILATLLLVTAAITWLFRYRLARAKEMLELRDRIALDLHDEVGSTLSSIALFSTAVQRSADEQDERRASMLRRIAENSTQAMESMNDIVWSVNTRHDRVGDVVDRMRTYAAPLAEARGWDLDLAVGPDIEDMRLGMNDRKDLYLIFKEALNNAAKYAEATRVCVSLRRSGDVLELEVSDDGGGIGTHEVEGLGGNGMHNMHRRAKALGGSLQVVPGREGGTQVVLRFVPRPTG